MSLLLAAIIATLASADVLCLLPCEVAAAATHRDSAGAPATDHCGGATPSSGAAAVLLAESESCRDQHAWASPAADRTAARGSVEPAVAAILLVRACHSTARRAERRTSGSPEDPPGGPTRTSTPLRI